MFIVVVFVADTVWVNVVFAVDVLINVVSVDETFIVDVDMALVVVFCVVVLDVSVDVFAVENSKY